MEAGSEHLENESSEVLDVLEPTIKFEDVKTFEQFTIRANGLDIDYEFSQHLRFKYYELCCSQKSYLHEHLTKDLNCKLVAGIISETVDIADAIKASKLSSSQCFPVWDKTLQSFEDLGMTVGFLRARIKRLARLACDTEVLRCKKDKMLELDRIEVDVMTMERRLSELNWAKKRVEIEIETLAMKADFMLQEEACSPW